MSSLRSIEMGCTDTEPFSTRTKHPFRLGQVRTFGTHFLSPTLWSPGQWVNSSARVVLGCDESQVVELASGEVFLSMRDGSGTRRAGLSTDGGSSFAIDVPIPGLALPEANGGCQGSLLTVGNLTYYSQPLSVDRTRSAMSVLSTSDSARTWSRLSLVYSGLSAYSSLVELAPTPSSGKLGIGLVYERDIEDCRGASCSIVFARIKHDDLTITSTDATQLRRAVGRGGETNASVGKMHVQLQATNSLPGRVARVVQSDDSDAHTAAAPAAPAAAAAAADL